jgi:hypothetical protein
MSDQWKQNFAEHTGQWAFALHLSRRQINALAYLREGRPLMGLEFPHFISIEAGLIRRGLIENIWFPMPNDRFPDAKSRYLKITPAGLVVCDLLVLAGLMEKPRLRVYSGQDVAQAAKENAA